VWNHIYRRARDTYYSKSDDMGSSWTGAKSFGSQIEYCKGAFTDHMGNLHIIFGDRVYLERVRLAQLVSEVLDCDLSDPGKTLSGIEALTTSVSYAGLFSDTGQNSTRVWITWIDNSLKGPGDSWDSGEQNLLNLAYGLDAGSTWQLYGYLTVPRTGTPGNEYIAVPRGADEGNVTGVCVVWLSHEQELLSYASILDLTGLSLTPPVVTLMLSSIIWINKVKRYQVWVSS